MKISNQVSGRFGNNFFQYLASKILQQALMKKGLNYTYSYNTTFNDPYIITDNTYFEHLEDFSKIPKNKDIYLQGYFQFDKHIIENKGYIKTILNVYNFDKINDSYTVSFIADRIKTFNRRFNDDEVILHLRLDDFIGDKIVMHYNNYFDIISTLPDTIKKVIIVVDKCSQQWEIVYLRSIDEFCKSKGLEVKFDCGDIFDDFCKLYYAKNFISSNSTYSYLAGLLGDHNLTWCPINTIYEHQRISKFDENTVSIKVNYL